MSELLRTSIGNFEWMRANSEKIANLFPPIWTHKSNINWLKVMFQIKVIGVEWRSEKEFAGVMVFLEKTKIIERDGLQIRRNPQRFSYER